MSTRTRCTVVSCEVENGVDDHAWKEILRDETGEKTCYWCFIFDIEVEFLGIDYLLRICYQQLLILD